MAFEPPPVTQKLILDDSQYRAGMARAAGSAVDFERAAVTAAASVIAIGGAWVAVSAVLDGVNRQIQELGRAQNVQRAFGGLSRRVGGARKGIQSLRDAVGGTVEDLKLMELANKALRTGVVTTARDLKKLAQTAKGASRIVGRDVANVFDKLTNAIGTGNVAALREFGVSTDKVKNDIAVFAAEVGVSTKKLTDQQKRAVTLRSVLEQLNRVIKETGADQETIADKWDQITTAVGNAVDRVRLWIANAPALEAILTIIADAVQDFVREGGFLDKILGALSGPGGSIPLFAMAIRFAIIAAGELIAFFPAMAGAFLKALSFITGTVLPELTTITQQIAKLLGPIAKDVGLTALGTQFEDFAGTIEGVNKRLLAVSGQAAKDAQTAIGFGRRARGAMTDLLTTFEEGRQELIQKRMEDGEDPKKDDGKPTFEKDKKSLIAGFKQISGAASQLQGALSAAFAASGKESKEWETAILASTAAIAFANGLLEFAAGWKATGDTAGGNVKADPLAAAAHFVSSAAYFTAAAVAGGQAAGALPTAGAGAGGVPGAVPTPPDLEDEDMDARRVRVELNIKGDVVANPEWIREKLAKQLSDEVKGDRAVLISTQSRATDAVRPGRVRTSA